MLQTGPYQVLYNSKFEFTAKSLVTNTVVLTMVLCTTTATTSNIGSIKFKQVWRFISTLSAHRQRR